MEWNDSRGIIWKPVKGYENYYEISNTGLVQSLNHVVVQKMFRGAGSRTYIGKILKPRKAKNGYLYVQLSREGERKTHKIHRLVSETFVEGKTEAKNQVNHKDGNKENNHYLNLEWCTCASNHKYAYETGLSTPCPFGEGSHNFKGKVLVLNAEGKTIEVLLGAKDIKEKGYTPAGVSAVLTSRQKTHRGYTFRRLND